MGGRWLDKEGLALWWLGSAQGLLRGLERCYHGLGIMELDQMKAVVHKDGGGHGVGEMVALWRRGWWFCCEGETAR